jgi:hypothetical protein
MGPTTYTLCQKPVIGVIMFIAFLCSFPPLINNQPVSLETAGMVLSTPFTVRVDKSYGFELEFVFPSVEARLRDEIVGSRYDVYCKGDVRYEDIPKTETNGLGRPMPFQVVVRRKSDRVVVLDRSFQSLCTFAHVDSKKYRYIGWVPLPAGEYIAEIFNLAPQSGLEGVKTNISLVSGHGKP